ncbi:hypothetical protein [Photobacterium piscicola]|uniref:hypothetical protein n=1 Tax=Photobacterium piscicola TaxID=1378299 RepID=UPI002E198E43|nr:hypothetical protein [Photobacterium piscicola]
MLIQRRMKNDRITHEQLVKLILLCSKRHSSKAEENKYRFKVREELIQRIMGMPLSHDDRFFIIREFNILGWQVAITTEFWLVFVVDQEKLFNWDEATYPYGLEGSIRAVQKGKEPPLSEVDHYYRFSSNKTAKFLGWSEEDIQEQLVNEALDRTTEEVQYQYEEDGDESLLGIVQGDEIDLTNFTSWDYLDYKLTESELVFNTK